MQTSDDIIIIEHLNKSYGKTQILQDLNLRVARGEFVAIVGPSGSGKSTLLHILGSIDRPSSGTVIVDGEDLNAISSKRIAKFRNQSIGFVFQFFYLQPHMTIAENLTVPMMPMRIPRNLRQQRIQTAAATVNIADKLNSYPKSLSGGELQRAAIARAITNQPKLILADEATGNIYSTKMVWNTSHLLGTDALGRDILARLMYGTRISLVVAFVAALVNMIIGILYGGASGYIGGMVDTVMMRIVDIISTIPLTLYVILIMQVMGDGIQSIIVALGSVYWVDMARVVRGQVLSLKQQEFVLAAKTIGSSPKTILLQHLIPNAMGSILVTLTMLIPSAIFMEAFLGYLGIGLQPPLASLGTMCNDASANLRTSPHELFIPALMICAIMFAFNFVGDGLRDALDPKLKK